MTPISKKECYIKVSETSLKNTNALINYNKQYFDKFRIKIDFSSFENPSQFQLLIKELKLSNANLSNFTFVVNCYNRQFSLKERENLKQFNEFLRTKNSFLTIEKKHKDYSCERFFEQMDLVDEVCYNIKSSNLSPLESFLFAYQFVSETLYKESPLQSSFENSVNLDVLETINNKNLMYADLLKQICDNLNNKNLICYINSCKANVNQKDFLPNTFLHDFNVVYLKDEKYNLQGFYCADAFLDRKKQPYKPCSLSHFMIPFDDLKFANYYSYETQKSNPFEYFISQEKPDIMYLSNEKVRSFLEQQKFVDIEQLRTKFKINILNQNKEIDLIKHKSLKAKLNRIPFGGEFLEYTFLKYVCNKIKKQTSTINYADFVNALWNVYIKAQNLNAGRIQDKIKEILENTKQTSFEYFINGAKNAFSTIAQADYSTKQTFLQQMENAKKKKRSKKSKTSNLQASKE